MKWLVPILLLWPTLTWGQTGSTELPEVEISDSKVLAQASYKSEKIDSVWMANNGELTLAEALSERTNIFVKTYGQGSLATLGMRGTGSQHTQLYWNGIPLNYPTLGLSDVSLFPVAMLDEVDVHFGAGSLTDGSGGLGGSLQLNNRLYFDHRLRVSGGLSGGSFGTAQGFGSLQMGNEKLQVRLRGLHRGAENNFSYRNVAEVDQPEEVQTNAAYVQTHLMPELAFRPKPNHRLVLRGWWTESARELPATMLVDTSEENQDDKTLRLAAEWQFSRPKFKSVLRSAYTDNRIIYRNPRIDLVSDNHSRVWHQQWRTSIPWKHFAMFKTALTYDHEEATSPGFERRRVRDRYAGLLDGRFYVAKRAEVNALLRQEITDGARLPILPAIGSKYRYWQGDKVTAIVQANVARNFHLPTLNDLYWEPGGNPDLLPEEGWMSELGSRFKWSSKHLIVSGDLTAFHSRIQNWIQWLPGDGNIWSPRNVREVYNQGIEAGVDAITTGERYRVRFKGKYSYTSSREQGGINDGNQLIYVPFSQASAEVRFIHIKGVSASWVTRFTDRRFITTDNESWLPSFWVSGFSVNYDRPPVLSHSEKSIWRWNLGFSVRNLLDQEYQAIVWRPMPGRSYHLSFKYYLRKP